ncbi:DUF6684 family protein [Natrononativus amylolyticus]|uniref:DUF6684 family protein n=1 Tax=Natrononativus amylolyticus TaxID=2963434 RepID=UPI0020CF26B5|nr:DUF6684 family protein [Natrononativus amylolyticus]
MSRSAFDAEMALDLAVNLIPLGILVFFIGLYALVNPWGIDPLRSTLQFAIIGFTAVGLALVTYVAARAIEGDPRTRGDSSRR